MQSEVEKYWEKVMWRALLKTEEIMLEHSRIYRKLPNIKQKRDEREHGAIHGFQRSIFYEEVQFCTE